MKCGDVQKYIEAWEQGEGVGPAAAGDIEKHVSQCAACGRRFGALLPLVLRDSRSAEAGAPDALLLTKAGLIPIPDIASSVMERIYGGGPSGKTAGMPGPSRRRFLLPAAALIAVLTAVTVLSPIFQSGGADEVTVHFILDLPDARSVSLAGDFTDWNPDLYRLSRKTEEGRWEVRVRLRKNRLYTYNFVIDGEEWIPDPGSYYRVEDGFGGESSLLQL